MTDSYFWAGGDGDFNSPNWYLNGDNTVLTGPPGPADQALLRYRNTPPATITAQGTLSVQQSVSLLGSTLNTSALNVTGRSNVNGQFPATVFVTGGPSILNVTLSTTVDGFGTLHPAIIAVGNGDGSGTPAQFNAGDVTLGDSNAGALNIGSTQGPGSARISGGLTLGQQSGSNGSVSLSWGGSSLTVNGPTVIGNAGTGFLSTGASNLRIALRQLILGNMADSRGTLNIGGTNTTLTATDIIVGHSGEGNFFLGGGATATLSGSLVLAEATGGIGSQATVDSTSITAHDVVVNGHVDRRNPDPETTFHLQGTGASLTADRLTMQSGSFFVGYATGPHAGAVQVTFRELDIGTQQQGAPLFSIDNATVRVAETINIGGANAAGLAALFDDNGNLSADTININRFGWLNVDPSAGERADFTVGSFNLGETSTNSLTSLASVSTSGNIIVLQNANVLNGARMSLTGGAFTADNDITIGGSAFNSDNNVTQVIVDQDPNNNNSPGVLGWTGTLDVGQGGRGSLLVDHGSTAHVINGGAGRLVIQATSPSVAETTVGSIVAVLDDASLTANDVLVGQNAALHVLSGGQAIIEGGLEVQSGGIALASDGISSLGTIEVQGGNGTLGNGTLTATAGTFQIDAGARVFGAGVIGGGGLSGDGVVNLGTIEARVDGTSTLTITANLSGGGATQIDAGATLDLQHSSDNTVNFTGTGTLELDTPHNFEGLIRGFAPRDRILVAANVSGVQSDVRSTVAGQSVSTVTFATSDGPLELVFSGDYAPADFSLSSSGNFSVISETPLRVLHAPTHVNDPAYMSSHSNDLTSAATASGSNHFIDFSNFEASFPDLIHAFGTNQQAMQDWYNSIEPHEQRVETFDGLDYVASYADLTNAFRSAGSIQAIEDAGATHFITNGLNEGRTTSFNGLDYIASYGDLIDALHANSDAGAYHYIENGRSEGRATNFDGLDYIASYSDLIAAFGANEQAGAAHYINNGRSEGRTTSFNGLDYVASYSDLSAAFGANSDAGATHYIQNGVHEGRTTSFDGLDYIASYGDLIAAFGANEQAGAAHYIQSGRNEGRTTSFDGLSYIAQYTDLMSAFGANNDAGAAHYITNGFAEHRGTSFDVAGYQQAHPDLQGRFASDDAFLTAYISNYQATGTFLT